MVQTSSMVKELKCKHTFAFAFSNEQGVSVLFGELWVDVVRVDWIPNLCKKLCNHGYLPSSKHVRLVDHRASYDFNFFAHQGI